MQSWLYLHFSSLQLDASFSEHIKTPLAIVDSKRFKVVQCNTAAQSQGIEIGMGLGSASTLCSQLQVHPYNIDIEHKALLNAAQWLYMVTSDISLFPPQGLLLKVTDMLSLYAGLDNYWQHVNQHMQSLNLTYSYSTGFSPISAILLSQSSAKLMTLDKETMVDTLHKLPISIAQLAPKDIERLQRIGVTSFKDLLTIPIQELARRFHIELVNYVGKLTGQFKHPIEFYHPPKQFECYQELLFEIETLQRLDKPLGKLLIKLESYLRLRNQVGYELELLLHHRDKKDTSVSFHSAEGDYLSSRWLSLSYLTLESVKLDAPVQALTLRLVRYDDLESTSKDLFCGLQGQQTPLELIGFLQAKLGRDKVSKVTHQHDPRPENAIVLCDPAKPVPFITSSNKLRPSFILTTPEPLKDEVALLQGPERLMTGWWDGNDIIRDYFIARSQQGRWLWIFRNQNKQWFLHGLFS